MTPSAGLSIVPVGRSIGTLLHGSRKKDTSANHNKIRAPNTSHHCNQIVNADGIAVTTVINTHCFHPYLVRSKDSYSLALPKNIPMSPATIAKPANPPTHGSKSTGNRSIKFIKNTQQKIVSANGAMSLLVP